MPTINAYLTFNGNCREAMTFYKECLGGELDFMTVSDTPVADQMPPEMSNAIMHSQLNGEGFTLMASDMCMGELVAGNNNSLLINCTSEAEQDELFEKLSAGGNVVMPVAEQFWGDRFGHLIDKFGFAWLLRYGASA